MHTDWSIALDVGGKLATIIAPLVTVAAVLTAFQIQRQQAADDARLASVTRNRLNRNAAGVAAAAAEFIIALNVRLQAHPRALDPTSELGAIAGFADPLGYWLNRDLDEPACVGAMLMLRSMLSSLKPLLERVEKLRRGEPGGMDETGLIAALQSMLGPAEGAAAAARAVLANVPAE